MGFLIADSVRWRTTPAETIVVTLGTMRGEGVGFTFEVIRYLLFLGRLYGTLLLAALLPIKLIRFCFVFETAAIAIFIFN